MIPAPPKRCHSGLVRVRSKLKFYRNQVTCWYKFCEGRLTASQNKTRAHCQQKHYCRHSCILTLLHRMFGRLPTILNHKHRWRDETSISPNYFANFEILSFRQTWKFRQQFRLAYFAKLEISSCEDSERPALSELTDGKGNLLAAGGQHEPWDWRRPSEPNEPWLC